MIPQGGGTTIWPGLSVLPPFAPLATEFHSASFAITDRDAFLAYAAQHGPELPFELSAAVAKRRAEFLAGRVAAQTALRALGRGEHHVGRDAQGVPIWPGGVIGSISHSAGIAVAAVAPQQAYASVGIDFELQIDGVLADQIQHLVADREELAVARSALGAYVSPSMQLSMIFSIKESLFKCLYPIAREFFDFQDAHLVSTTSLSTRDGECVLELKRPLGSLFPSESRFSGRFAFDQGRVQTAIAMRASALHPTTAANE